MGDFSWVHGYLKEVQKKIQGGLKGSSRVFLGSFKCDPKVFYDVSRKIEGCFNGVLSGFQGCLQEVEWCLRQVSKVFQGIF